MTTLADRIKALPGWPERGAADVQPWQTIVHEHRAALARLALAREWIADRPHTANCTIHGSFAPTPRCSCGRDALLAAIGEPE